MYTILCKSLIHLIFFNTNFVLDVYFMTYIFESVRMYVCECV